MNEKNFAYQIFYHIKKWIRTFLIKSIFKIHQK